MSGWRTLIVSSDAYLKLYYGNIHLVHSDGRISLPIEDIDHILIDSPGGAVSIPLLQEIARRGISFLIIDRTYTPAGILLPYNTNRKAAGILHEQINLKEPFKKRVWQKIIKQKIINCSRVLRILKKPGSVFLQKIADEVKSGDSTNREAYAAKHYFRILDPAFIRCNESPLSSALDYGYAIVRSVLARYLAAAGLQCALGVWHKSKTNPFNLADDFVEVFRPFVDALVFSNPPDKELDSDYKQYLVKVLKMECIIESKIYAVSTAANEVAQSYVRAVLSKKPALLKLPQIEEISFRIYGE